MKTFLPHTYTSEVDIDSNTIRGSLISQKIFDEIKDSEKVGNSFGRIHLNFQLPIYQVHGLNSKQ